MKNIFLLACLVILLAPHSASAFKHRRRINADEMVGIGGGAAALIGVAGYFLLRRRNTD